jgi:DNA-binding CsgD family transcriptional regulator
MEKNKEIVTRLSCCSKVTDTGVSELSVKDIEKLIDIVSKLQYIDNNNIVSSLLGDLDSLLGVNGSALGIYDYECQTDEYVGSTIDEKYFTQLRDYSNFEDSDFVAYFENKNEEFGSFLYLKCNEIILKNRQIEILNIVLPYLYAGAMKLYSNTRQLLFFGLTSRELEVMQWLITGKDNWSISKILGVSERTIKFHNCNIYKKLGVNSKVEAISFYHRHNASH